MKNQKKPTAKADSIPLTPRGKVSAKKIDSLAKLPGVKKLIGTPIQGKFPAQQSDNIKKLLSKGKK